MPNTPFNTSAYFAFATSLSGVQGVAMTVLHPTLPKGIPKSLNIGAPLLTTVHAYQWAAAKTILGDGELFYVSYPQSAGSKIPATYVKNVLARVVAGRGADAGMWFICGCGVSQNPITAPYLTIAGYPIGYTAAS